MLLFLVRDLASKKNSLASKVQFGVFFLQHIARIMIQLAIDAWLIKLLSRYALSVAP